MDKNLSTVLAVAVAGIIQVAVTEGPFTLWNVMIGVVLICVLLTYRPPSEINRLELAALSAVWGLTIVITTGVGVQLALAHFFPHVPRLANGEVQPRWFFFIWLGCSVLAFAIGYVVKRKRNVRWVRRITEFLETKV